LMGCQKSIGKFSNRRITSGSTRWRRQRPSVFVADCWAKVAESPGRSQANARSVVWLECWRTPPRQT
jgi:hypothetical protein